MLRVIFNLPPRYSKSELTTIIFDAWLKGLDPQFSFVSASYSADLAETHGVTTRNIISDPAYKLVFPDTAIAKGMGEKTKWQTEQGGMRIATGVGGTLTGKGGSGISIDDPHKPLITELSDSARGGVISWFENTLYSRLDDKKLGFIILTMQRLHDSDLTGYLLEQGDESGFDYTHCVIAATNNHTKTYSYGNFSYERAPDEPIWEEFEGKAEIAANRRIMKASFSPQYDQDPIDESDTHFKLDKFIPFDYFNPPDRLLKYGTSDFAVSEEQVADWTVQCIWGQDSMGLTYLLELIRKQVESDVWVEDLLDMHEEFNTYAWFGEKGQIEKSVGPFLRTRMRERRIFPNIITYPTTGDKKSRNQSFRGRHNLGMIRYPVNAPWYELFYKEMKRFPKGKNDDQVDNTTLIGLGLDDVIGPGIIGAKPKKSWKDRLKHLGRQNHSTGGTKWMRA